MATFRVHFYGDDVPSLTVEADTSEDAGKAARAQHPGLAIRKIKLDREQPGQRRNIR